MSSSIINCSSQIKKRRPVNENDGTERTQGQDRIETAKYAEPAKTCLVLAVPTCLGESRNAGEDGSFRLSSDLSIEA
jgi:hypothetical protein